MRTRRLLTALAVIAFAAVLLHPAVLQGRVFFERDVHAVWMAQAEALHRSLAAGAWPPWDHTVAFGVPLVANPNQQAYYPPAWLALLVAPWRAYTLVVFLHVTLAAAGVYRLTRRYAVSRVAALTAGALYGASGPLLSFVNVWHHLAGAALLPWIVLAAERTVERPCRRRAVAWGGLAALQVLAGSPDMCVLATAIVAARVSVALVARREDGVGRRAVLLAAAGAAVLALGLAAAQWMPTLEAVRNAHGASRDPANRAVWALHPFGLVQLLLPLSFEGLPRFAPGAPGSSGDLWQGFVRSVYLGLPAVGLALVGLLRSRGFERSFWAGVSAASLLYSLGRVTPVFIVLSGLPPFSSLRYPSKFSIGVALGFAVLAGLGVERLREDVSMRHRRWLGWWLAGAGAAAAALLAAAQAGAGGRAAAGVLAESRGDVAVAAAASFAASLGIVLARKRVRPAVVTAGVAVACVAELAVVNHDLNRTTDPGLFRYRPEILDVVGIDPLTRLYVWDYAVRIPGHPRPTDPLLGTFMEPADPLAQALGMQMYLYPPTAGRWGLSGSYDRDLLGLLPGPVFWAGYGLRWAEGTPAFAAALRNGGVDFVVALHGEGQPELREITTLRGLYRRPIRVFRVPGTLPRTYVVSRARRASTEQALAKLFDPGWNARTEVLVGDGPELDGSPSPAGWSRISLYRPDRVRLEATLSEPGYVVLLDTWDSGWVATRAGHRLPVEKANGLFRAVYLPPGTHDLEMVYRPGSARLGLLATGLTLVVSALLASRRGRSARTSAAR
jgi:hypothetical protein